MHMNGNTTKAQLMDKHCSSTNHQEKWFSNGFASRPIFYIEWQCDSMQHYKIFTNPITQQDDFENY